jgi:hypothetical protein
VIPEFSLMNREMSAIGEGKGGDLLDAKNEMLKRMCDNSEAETT